MPIDVEPGQRLRAIAEATLAVARQHGADAITIRSVASEMGGSTALITNYLPSRARLIDNALEYALGLWRAEVDAELQGVEPAAALPVLMRCSLSTTGDDELLRRLYVERLAASPERRAGVLFEDGARQRNEIASAVTAADSPDPEQLADVLYLLTRGFYFAAAEEPASWTSERVQPLVEWLLGRLGSPDS